LAISNRDVQQIVEGSHSDPFAVLGPHLRRNGLSVALFAPEARSVDLIDQLDGVRRQMRKRHKLGFFQSVLRGRDTEANYLFETTRYDGSVVQFEDPYRFPTHIGRLDEEFHSAGVHRRIYDFLGAHHQAIAGVDGVTFAVWAPSAFSVSVVADFNDWDGRRHPMRFHHDSGIWDLFVPGLSEGVVYKYEIASRSGQRTAKSDPCGFQAELRPNSASVVCNVNKYEWSDTSWMERRAELQSAQAPISIYEVHLGSWQRHEDGSWLSYRELADKLVDYVTTMGFTHVEFMPVSEHPLDESWGYQVSGYFAATSRFGSPIDFKFLIDRLHVANIGVILDWVPAHFPADEHGLSLFDGTHLYEHADPLLGRHPDWGTLIFDYGRPEIRQFLIANALFWLDLFHVDGLRVDAVASMLYLDYSRKDGEWRPNRLGGREYLEAIEFIKELNGIVHRQFPGVIMIAEESTAWDGVTRAINEGGLGFDYKWNMGWMHDTLKYFQQEPIHRSYYHDTLTFSLLYAFSENYLLPFSHDEVVHLKRSLSMKMPGDAWQQHANLRALFAYQVCHPGKHLLFMGSEFGQHSEWHEGGQLEWSRLDTAEGKALQSFVARLNQLYRSVSALHVDDRSWDGFVWLDPSDRNNSILAFARRDPLLDQSVYVAINLTPVARHHYRMGVFEAGRYKELLNSDDVTFGGSGIAACNVATSSPIATHGQEDSIEITLPPLAAVLIVQESLDA